MTHFSVQDTGQVDMLRAKTAAGHENMKNNKGSEWRINKCSRCLLDLDFYFIELPKGILWLVIQYNNLPLHSLGCSLQIFIHAYCDWSYTSQ